MAIAFLEQTAVFSIRDDFAQSRHIGAHHDLTHGHGFKGLQGADELTNDIRCSREGCNVDDAVVSIDIVMGHTSSKANTITNIQLVYHGFKFISGVAVPNQ